MIWLALILIYGCKYNPLDLDAVVSYVCARNFYVFIYSKY
jgi:uncharacterized membrane protein YkgB